MWLGPLLVPRSSGLLRHDSGRVPARRHRLEEVILARGLEAPRGPGKLGLVRSLGTIAVAGVTTVCLSLAGMATEKRIVQPDSAELSVEQRAELLDATKRLESVLADPTLGSQVTASSRAWTSKEFSAYTAGTLQWLGYEASVVVDAWTDEEHAWVLVRIALGGAATWIPVEATPSANARQVTPGRIPWSGGRRYDSRYVSFDRELSGPPNQPPVASVRLPAAAPRLGEGVALLGLLSQDPDGEIILYVWTIDSMAQPTASTSLSTYEYAFAKAGWHSIQLTVVDNRGGRATTSAQILVHGDSAARDEEGEGTSGCGCGS